MDGNTDKFKCLLLRLLYPQTWHWRYLLQFLTKSLIESASSAYAMLMCISPELSLSSGQHREEVPARSLSHAAGALARGLRCARALPSACCRLVAVRLRCKKNGQGLDPMACGH